MSPTENTASGPRLAIILSHPTQYYSPWFRAMKEKSPLCFKVFYLSDTGITPALDEKFGMRFAWDVNLTEGYDWETVPNMAKRPDVTRFFGLKNPALHRRLADWKPDAILLFGYNYATHMKLVAWARLHRIPLIFRGDSHLLGRSHLPPLKRILLRMLFRQFAAITHVGMSNRDYFKRFGIPDTRLFFAPHAVNSDHFNPTKPEHRERALKLRARLGIPPDFQVVLFSGKFIGDKQPLALLESFIQLNPQRTALVFVGDGKEKTMLEARAASRPEVPVHFLPFANQSEMPSVYLLADLLVLPSNSLYETWGLAVNEAMCMGVPCLVSDLVGCQADLVHDRETGWVFQAGSSGSLRTKLNEALATLETTREKFRAAALETISRYSYANATAGVMKALEFAIHRP